MSEARRTSSRRGKKADRPKAAGQVAITPSAPPKYDDISDTIFFTVDITGEEGTGKSHFARTFPGDLAWIETPPEVGKAEPLLRKFRDVYKDGKKVYLKKVATFNDARNVVYDAIKRDDIKTIVIDSGTDLRWMAGKEWMEEKSRETGKVIKAVHPPTQWQYPNAKIDELISVIKKAEKFLVVTNRKKDQWVNDMNTGLKIRAGHAPLTYNLHFTLDIKPGLQDSSWKRHLEKYRFATVKKNFMWGIDKRVTYGKPYLFDITYDGILAELLVPWGPHPLDKALTICVEEAKEWVKIENPA